MTSLTGARVTVDQRVVAGAMNNLDTAAVHNKQKAPPPPDTAATLMFSLLL